MYPENLKYTETHEWARLEDDGETVTVGITQHAVEQLSDIVFVELPETGTPVSKGESFGAVESVKAVVDLNSPVTGEVTNVNKPVTEKLDLITKDPYGEGWIIKIKAKDKSELESLMNSQNYEKSIT